MIQNKHVLEIGAGIGLPSLMMAGVAKSIQISDYDKEAVALLQKNIEHLQLQNAEALQLDWNAIPENLQPDVILLSDVNYDPGQFDVLIHLIDEIHEPRMHHYFIDTSKNYGESICAKIRSIYYRSI